MVGLAQATDIETAVKRWEGTGHLLLLQSKAGCRPSAVGGIHISCQVLEGMVPPSLSSYACGCPLKSCLDSLRASGRLYSIDAVQLSTATDMDSWGPQLTLSEGRRSSVKVGGPLGKQGMGADASDKYVYVVYWRCDRPELLQGTRGFKTSTPHVLTCRDSQTRPVAVGRLPGGGLGVESFGVMRGLAFLQWAQAARNVNSVCHLSRV